MAAPQRTGAVLTNSRRRQTAPRARRVWKSLRLRGAVLCQRPPVLRREGADELLRWLAGNTDKPRSAAETWPAHTRPLRACAADEVAVEIVDLHAGIDHDPLCVDAAGAWAEQEGCRVGHFFGPQGLFA